jgi:hypothetical protein
MQAALAHGAASHPSRGFLEKILPSEGYYFAAEQIPHGGMRHHVAKSVDELVSLVEQLDGQGKTVFHACASYANDLVFVGGKAKQRVQENVKGIRAFWLDLDVGGAEGKFPTQAAANGELDRFVADMGLPNPMRVSSGYGVHAYWPLAEGIGREQWAIHANWLKGLCEAHGLKADHSRTTDCASILRPVGSHNRKDQSNPRPVELLQDADPIKFADLSAALGKACSNSGVNAVCDPAAKYERAAESVNSQFLIPPDYPDSYAQEITGKCNQIRLMRDSKGCIAEPQWYAAIGVLCRTVEAPEVIHEWSNGHTNYTVGETERKIARAMECGPTTCVKFRQVNPAGCAGCSHTITSPIVLGSRQPEQQSADVIEFPGRPPEIDRWIDPNTPTATPAKLKLFDLSAARIGSFLDTLPPRRRYLLKDCLPCGKVGAIVAPGGTGKSQFVLQLAAAVATGERLADHWEVEEVGAVLGLFAEDDKEELHRRLHGIAKGVGESPAARGWRERMNQNLYLHSMVGQDNQMTCVKPGAREAERTDYADRLIATVEGIENLKLIILDPASRFRGGSENDAQDSTRFIEACEYVAQQTGATVLILHHANKGSMQQGTEQTQSAARGSSAFTDGIRWQMNLATLSKDEASGAGIPDDQRGLYLSARITKNNYAPPQLGAVFMKRGEHGFLSKAELQSESSNGPPLYIRVLQLVGEHDGELTARRFRDEFSGLENALKAGEKAVRGVIHECIGNGLIEGGDKAPLKMTTTGRETLSAVLGISANAQK